MSKKSNLHHLQVDGVQDGSGSGCHNFHAQIQKLWNTCSDLNLIFLDSFYPFQNLFRQNNL